MTETIAWPCRGGHILGHIIREGHMTRLALYRHAVCPGEAGVVIAVVVGNVDAIVCSECGRHRDWHAGEVALARLLRRYTDKNEETG